MIIEKAQILRKHLFFDLVHVWTFIFKMKEPQRIFDVQF